MYDSLAFQQKNDPHRPHKTIHGGAAGYCLRVLKIFMTPFYTHSYLFRQLNPTAANNKTVRALIKIVEFGMITSLTVAS